MWVNGVVVLHPAIDEAKSGSGIGDQPDPDIVAFERLHERLGHAVALWALDGGEAGHQIQRHGDLDGAVSGEDRAVVGEPLNRMRCTDTAETLLDAADHHVADHLAGDAAGGGDPADRLPVMAVEGKGHPHRLAVPESELQRVRAPATIRNGPASGFGTS